MARAGIHDYDLHVSRRRCLWVPARARDARLAGTTDQDLRWIIRSTERRAFAAISGSITTSSFIYTRLSRIFGNVMRFMCGAEIARLDELDVRQLHLHVVGHRTLGDHHDALRL